MEGPSLYLASQQLQPFVGKTVKSLSGNTKIGKERLLNKEVLEIFSWGKHLVFQFDEFAIRTHFMLFGTFEATIDGVQVTGDYKRAYEPRLKLDFDNGEIEMFNCSIKFIESKDAKGEYDFSIDVMSKDWDEKKALKNVLTNPKEQIADVLLDQEIFAGVGNMIKNEVLSIVKVNPKVLVGDLSESKLKKIVKVAHDFSWQFYKWRKEFVLRKNLKVHRKKYCPHCEAQIIREKTGKRQRWSYFCPVCQPQSQ
jgi:endonuclease VIII